MSHFGSVAALRRLLAKPRLYAAGLVALTLVGCARQQTQPSANATPAASRPAYCQPRPAPDCELRQTSLKTVDPEEFARLKLAYERRCARHAEKAERERMRELRASGACDSRPAPSLAAGR
jgi:hypothetical protein